MREVFLPFRLGVEDMPVATALAVGSLPSFHIELNAAARRLFGRSSSSRWKGHEWLDHVRRPDGAECPVDESPSYRSLRGEVSDMELVIASTNSPDVPVRVRSAPLYEVDGSLNGAVLVFDDLSAQKLAERKRAQWNASVAHELRQPLNTVHLYAQLLRTTLPQGASLDAVEELDAAAMRLARMVNDLLDFSCSEGNRSHAEPTAKDELPLSRPRALSAG